MKTRYFAALLMAFIIIHGCSDGAADRTIRISGDISGLVIDGRYARKDTLFLYYDNTKGERVTDTMTVKNGKFSLNKQIDIDKLTMGRIFITMDTVTKWVMNGYYPSAVSRVDFLLYPGAKITIKGEIKDFVDAYAYDGNINDMLADLAKMTHPIENEAVNKQVLYAKLDYYTGENAPILTDAQSDSVLSALGIESFDRGLLEELDIEISELEYKSLELKKDFVKNHPESDATSYILLNIQNSIDNETTADLFAGLEDGPKNNPFGQVLNKRLLAIEATKIGKPAPDISGISYEGKEFSLEQLKGKVVLIDFWGTWCGPCLDGIPKLKELYSKYSGELEILGVASDSEKAWREGVERLELSWIHLLDLDGELAINNYNITGFPTKFILDRDGVIIYKEIGEEENSGIEEHIANLIANR